MSVRATNWAWEKGRELRLPQGLRFLLVRVGDHADNDGVCWPGIDGLADYLGCDESTVRRNLQRLEELDLLHRERREAQQGRGRRTDAIHLHMVAQDQPGVLHGRSSTTNRAPVRGPTGHSTPDQPCTSARPYIEEPSGTHREPSTPPDPPDGGEAISIEDRRDRVKVGSRRKRDLAAVLASIEPTPEAERAWDGAREELSQRLSEAQVGMYLDPLHVVGELGDELVLAGPTAIVGWVRRRLRRPLADAVRASSAYESVSIIATDREEASVA